MAVFVVLICILMISFAIHEAGHALAAISLGQGLKAVGVGFGPSLWQRNIHGVDFRLGVLPFGAYVEPRDGAATPGMKLIVALAGPLANLFAAALVGTAVLTACGDVRTPLSIQDQAAVSAVPLKKGDLIVQVNGMPVADREAFLAACGPLGDVAEVIVLRNGTRVGISGRPVDVVSAWGQSAEQAVVRVSAVEALDSLVAKSQILFRFLTWAVSDSSAAAVRRLTTPDRSSVQKITVQRVATVFFVIGMSMAVFSLLPIPPMDGGAMLILAVQAWSPWQLRDDALRKIAFVGVCVGIAVELSLCWPWLGWVFHRVVSCFR